MAAARAMLDEEHVVCPRQANDTNSYVVGSIKNHNVVIACLPIDQYGTNNAASVLSNMRRTFPNIEIGLMVGIGGGVPLKADIRLGDIVVGVRVMQYDLGKTLSGGFQRTGVPKIPDSTIRTVISNLRSRHELSGSRVPSILREKMGSYADYNRPNEPDRLFLASYHHDDAASPCEECDSSKLETRKMRLSTDPVIYYGAEDCVVQERHKEILESLNFEEIDARKSIIKVAHFKTCRWFLKHPDYLSWIDWQQISQHRGFLWIRGKPGAGKSTIMKFIYSESKKTDIKIQRVTASFFFNARDLECVLDDPDILPRNQNGCPPLNVLKDLLRAAVAKLGQRSFTCFIDALDECDEQEVMDLVEYFEDLAEQCTEDNVNLRICFSSRHYPYIDIKFGMRIILEQQTGHTSDLEKYIMANLRISKRSLLVDLRDKMLEKAAGVFLWVVLVVSILNKESRRGGLALKTRLQEVPSGLSDLFKDLLKRDTTNMEELQLSLLWILLSHRPLKPEEYYHAIWSGLYMKGLADPDIPQVDTGDSEDCSARCVISSSKGLAEITKVEQPRVQFIHESVRDFLIKDRGLQELWPELGPDWESVGHDRLKLCCYSYFQLVTRKLKIEDSYLVDEDLLLGIETYPFLEYASQSVLHHANFASNIANQQSFLKNFSTSVWKRVVNAFEKHKVRKYSPVAGLLYILADRGHSSLIQTRLKSDANIYAPSEKDRYVYPLVAAMAKGDKSSVIALLGLTSGLYDGVDITERLVPNKDAGVGYRTPLSWACKNGYLGIARVLVERDAQPTNAGGGGYSPLMLASKNGHTDIARWLFSRGTNIHERYKKESAISLATSNGHEETVEFLLNVGADPNTCGVQDIHILLLAIEKGNEKVTKLLLEKGASINAKNTAAETPLHIAAQKKGSVATMEALLSYGAEIDARDSCGRTPLTWAANQASIEEIEFLIGQGADATAQDIQDETCIHKAMRRKNATLEIVRFLLRNGARADARSESGQTCLHTFRPWGAVIPFISDLIQLVTSRGTDINANDNDGNTPLHLMTKCGNVENLSTFADQPGLDLNARNRLGKTPLHVAALRSPSVHGTEILAMLIKKGADVNSLDNEARTPLDDAMERGHEKTIQLLMENGGKRGVE
ncbi:Ankyrin repeat [Fusarium oxysporum f. sp. vasinfectum]|nr:Ankyrin repeat [Fusarium oxysporum f. sp. vasinfectum]